MSTAVPSKTRLKLRSSPKGGQKMFRYILITHQSIFKLVCALQGDLCGLEMNLCNLEVKRCVLQINLYD